MLKFDDSFLLSKNPKSKQSNALEKKSYNIAQDNKDKLSNKLSSILNQIINDLINDSVFLSKNTEEKRYIIEDLYEEKILNSYFFFIQSLRYDGKQFSKILAYHKNLVLRQILSQRKKEIENKINYKLANQKDKTQANFYLIKNIKPTTASHNIIASKRKNHPDQSKKIHYKKSNVIATTRAHYIIRKPHK